MARQILKKRKPTLRTAAPSEGLARRQKQLGAQISRTSGTAVPCSHDPVYHMINSFTTQFDAVGRQRAAALGSERTEAEHGSEQTPGTTAENRRSADTPMSEERKRQLRRKHDFPMYRHSREQLENGSFADRFASYAFNGGNMAAAVMAGQGKQMFTSCLKRALGRPMPDSPKQKSVLMQNAIENKVDGTEAKVVFNRHAQSAVGIVLDSIRGASTTLEVFRKLANESGAIKDTPMEHYNIETMKTVYPYLVTAKDKAQLSEYNSQLKALEGDNSPDGIQRRRTLEWARDRQKAMLERKAAEQRRLLTVLTSAQANVKAAEKLFSSDGFAESVVEEIDRLQEDIPPDDNNNRSGLDMLIDFLAWVTGNGEQADIAKPQTEQGAEQQNAQRPEEQPEQEQRPTARSAPGSRGRRR